jgi:energy-coupling factor transporter ATP-binding protein EcfA2
MSLDERLRVFLTDSTDVFHSVEHRHEIWKDDPFDVPSVHAEARQVFERLVARTTTATGATSGRILLLLGDSGAGKTHLLRAFRSHVHKNRGGFVGYMQLTSASNNYARYVLSNLIDSLDQPYDEPVDTRTGLVRIAAVLASRAFEPKLAAMLRDDGELDDDEVSDLVNTGADRLIVQKQYQAAELDVLRALLYLHRPDPRIKSRIFKYLRCEDLSEGDRKRIGGIMPKTEDEHPAWMIQQIGRLLSVIVETPMSLILCIDQLEGLYDLEALGAPFRRAMTTLGDLAEIPSIIVVLCCLEDAYRQLGQTLHRSLRDRIEHDPEPIRLHALRSPEETRRIVAERLRHLYTSAGVGFDEQDPLYPFPSSFIADHEQLRTRDLIEGCRGYRERCKKAGKLVDARHLEAPVTAYSGARAKEVERWEQRWNDFLADSEASPTEDDNGLAALLCWAIARAGEELESGHRFETSTEDGAVRVTARGPDKGATEHLYVALCNRTPQFGWLARQISQHTKTARADANEPVLVLTRNDDFPEAKTVSKEIAIALQGGGRRVIVQNAEWRAMIALQRFSELHHREAFFSEWRADENHMSRLGSIRDIVDLDHMERLGTAMPAGADVRAGAMEQRSPASSPPTAPVAVPPSTGVVEAPGALLVGTTVGVMPRPTHVTTAELTCHAAFLGGSGSGKTTVALSLIEQLLVSGVPVLMLDRKGDLAGYARQETLQRPLADGALDERRKKLLSTVDVALFTPGHPEGRPISISVAPEGLSEMPQFEREEAATLAAHALGDMLGYKQGGRDATLRAILMQALRVLSQEVDQPIVLDTLIPFIADADPALVAAVGRLDTKLFTQIVQGLETLKLTASRLFGVGSEPLDVDLFLGTGPHARPGRTRLTIISTKFLRDDAQIQFWVAQLLLAILRWAGKRPRSQLQAALLFDEADLYLPAMRQPATKAPMESLLKRGRSAGLGVMLATQSPGDLDYRCRDTIRTWFLGRIKEQTALAKLKPMLSESPVDVSARLPGQETGEFHLVREGNVTHMRTHRSVLATEQLPDADLLLLARRTREITGSSR